VSVNETRSSAKLTVYSIAYNDIYSRVLKNMITLFWHVYILVCRRPPPPRLRTPFACGYKIPIVMPMNRQGKV
jgi:hypothetical protein